MFSGIIETTGKVYKITPENSNLHLTIESKISSEVNVGDSISHNGICLTVTSKASNSHSVVAAKETIDKTNIKSLQEGAIINLERSLKPNNRFDGHIVQGHVDSIAIHTQKQDLNGSQILTFSYEEKFKNLIIEKGSIALNGISLTTINVTNNSFSVSIIPYTLENTNLKQLKINDQVNIEFDILGKYVDRLMNNHK